jgi:hypothetical protein
MSEYQSTIFVRFSEPGMHCWPDAPEHRWYLRSVHRHIFHIEAEIPVHHHDREVEFHDLMDVCRDRFKVLDESASCEQMARWIHQHLTVVYKRPARVTVSEDNECGSTISTL